PGQQGAGGRGQRRVPRAVALTRAQAALLVAVRLLRPRRGGRAQAGGRSRLRDLRRLRGQRHRRLTGTTARGQAVLIASACLALAWMSSRRTETRWEEPLSSRWTPYSDAALAIVRWL